MDTAIVIPVGPSRRENLVQVMRCIQEQTVKPNLVVLVCDGPDAHMQVDGGVFDVPLAVMNADEKHVPGREQPRNAGARFVEDLGVKDRRFASIDTLWFLDTDVIVGADCLERYDEAMKANDEPRILVGPYEWLPPGLREPVPSLHNDPRWVSFNGADPAEVKRGDLSAGLACFSGNLLWPLEAFRNIGGFWDELHHGRCEDGELGLRAVEEGVGISFVPGARGWHLYHDFSTEWVQKTNAIDVPKLNARHPWVEGSDELFVVDEDGKRLNVRCGDCGWEGNTAEIWQHKEVCEKA
jgi:hypothetical protein